MQIVNHTSVSLPQSRYGEYVIHNKHYLRLKYYQYAIDSLLSSMVIAFCLVSVSLCKRVLLLHL